MEDIRKETPYEKLQSLQKLSGKDDLACRTFIDFVATYLNNCGYFEADFNIHGFKKPDNWIKYWDRDFGRWLLDMALQYNMEQGKEYKCELIIDRQNENK